MCNEIVFVASSRLGSATLRAWVQSKRSVASRDSQKFRLSALARRTREFPRDADAIELVRKRLRTDWPKHVGQSCQDAGDAGLGLNRQPDAMSASRQIPATDPDFTRRRRLQGIRA
jgi:hypothetical protein